MKLIIVPVSLKTANTFVSQYHRHHKKVQGCKFCIGSADTSGTLHGVAIVGRPVSRHLDTGFTAEVTRLCTDGTRNACSLLYAACARAAREIGFTRIQTYILESEPGISLMASGWIFDGAYGGGNWNVKGRPREDSQNTAQKKRYCKILRERK